MLTRVATHSFLGLIKFCREFYQGFTWDDARLSTRTGHEPGLHICCVDLVVIIHTNPQDSVSVYGTTPKENSIS